MLFATIYWIPAFAGMTGAYTQSSFRRKPESSDCYPDLWRSYDSLLKTADFSFSLQPFT